MRETTIDSVSYHTWIDYIGIYNILYRSVNGV